MALINCPECGREISDKAISCPHCGVPLQGTSVSNLVNTQTLSNSEKSKSSPKRGWVKVALSVLIILTIAVVGVAGYLFYKDSQVPPEPELDLAEAEKRVVKVVCYDWLDNVIANGSGFFYPSCFGIVTNYHVIEDAYRIEIVTYDDQVYEAHEVVNYSKNNDIAILSPSGIPTSFPAWSNEDVKETGIEKGDKVYAIGSPLGLKNTVSEGIVSGWVMDGDMNVIQCTAPISPGSSGGVLLDEYGKIIGITYSSFTAGQNINLAIPIKYATELWTGRDKGNIVKTSRFFENTHEYGSTVGMFVASAEHTDCVSVDEFKRNYERYKLVCVDGYVSGFDTIRNDLAYFTISNGNVISGDVYSDTEECLNYGIRNSNFLIVNMSGKPITNNKINIGDYVRVIAMVKNDQLENGMIIGLFVINEETDGYFSVFESWIENATK